MPSVERDYPAAWRDYRWRSYPFLGSLIVLVPGAILVGTTLSARFGNNPAPFFVTWLLMGVVVGSFSFWLWRWRCPRCGKPFHEGMAFHNNPLAQKCYTCGLPKQEPRPGARSSR